MNHSWRYNMTTWLALLCIAVLQLAAPALGARRYPERDKRSEIEILDAAARIVVWHHFLTDDECDYIRMKAEKRLERSGVVDTSSGGSQVSDIRTSDGMFFARAEDKIIEGIERRLAEWTLMPVENGEGLQVLRYKKEQKYEAHWDYFFDKENSQNGGNRYSTVLMYLAAAQEGGETVFPKLPAKDGINLGYSECAKHHLAVRVKKGDAILFHSMKPGTPDLEERSMHTACPVIKGEKWSMTKWIRARQYIMNDVYDEEAEHLRHLAAEFEAKGEVVAQARKEFELGRGANDMTAKYLLSEGRKQLKQLTEMLDLQQRAS